MIQATYDQERNTVIKSKSPSKRLMDFLGDQGVTEILRVIPDPAQDIGLNIMGAFHYSKGVKFLTLQSREEAQSRL